MPSAARIASVLTFAALPLCATAQEAASVQQERYLFELLRAGGWTMVPLGLCLLAALYLLVYCWRETSPRRFFTTANASHSSGTDTAATADAIHSSGTSAAATANENHSSDTDAGSTVVAQTATTRAKGNHTPATTLHREGHTERASASAFETHATASATLFDRALARGLSKMHGKSGADARTAAENAISETLTHAEAEQLRWIGYLNIIAAIAPMIGLLGTVSGMIGAFGTISVGGMGRPEMLAGNIGEALVSTATGLAVGIPAMLCYHVLHNRLGLRMNETVSRLNDALDARI